MCGVGILCVVCEECVEVCVMYVDVNVVSDWLIVDVIVDVD